MPNNMRTEDIARNATPVIMVYAHGGRVAEMRLVDLRDGEVTAKNPVTGAVIDLPRDIVFGYDAGLFAQLTEAREQGRPDLLAALWTKAVQYAD